MRKKCSARRLRSGQSTVEYIVLATAVMAVVLIFFNGSGSIFQARLNNTFEQTSNDIADRGEKLFTAHGSDAGAFVAPTAAMGVNMLQNVI